MWLIFAVGSAFFAGITAILAKCGIKNISSDLATAVRTVVVLIFSWAIAFFTVPTEEMFSIPTKTLVFLCLSGIATGASWLCYFRALQLGDVNKVTPVDKCSSGLTIILAAIFLGESLNFVKGLGTLMIAVGTLMMIEKKGKEEKESKKGWLFYAVLSMIFASLTSILGKIGIEGVNSNLGTAVRTSVVLVMAWIVVFVTGKFGDIRKINRKNMLFLAVSGITTGASWLCYYRALQIGRAGYVTAVDKMSVLITVLFSGIVLGERLSRKAAAGLFLLAAGTLLLVV